MGAPPLGSQNCPDKKKLNFSRDHQKHLLKMAVTQRRIVGLSTTTILLCISIASLVISVQDRTTNPVPNCGVTGSPPLREYLLGTGISYLVISASFLIVSIKQNASIFSFILGVSNLFLFCWMIVGCVSLWRDGFDCQAINPAVWKMGMAAVICSIIVVCLGGYTNYRTVNDED
jgi:hypothetical protein